MSNKGIILKAVSGFYYVETGNGLLECKARGVFRNIGESPVVGDYVMYNELGNNKGIIEEICERKNVLSRPPIANVDKMFIVSSYTTPAPSTLVIDTMTSIADDKGIDPIIVFNKCDMGSFDELCELYRKAGFKVYVVSVKTKQGIDNFLEEMKGSVSVFAGNTGVGKSSLLNVLFPDFLLKTGDVSQKLGRGRHTTRHVELFSVDKNTWVADTPGFSSLDIEQSDIVYKENLQFAFREFAPYINSCKFTGCSHTGEKGCSISSAVDNGEIPKSRYENYKSLYAELAKRKDWEIRK